MFRWIIDDTRALIRDLRKAFESVATRWRWFRIRSRQKIDKTAADLDNVRKSAVVTTRMCRSCRALIPVDVRVCPECGDAPGERVSRGVTRVLENMMPGAMSVSAGLLTSSILAYGLSLMVWGTLQEQLPTGLRDRAWDVTLWALGANTPGFVFEGEVWRLLTSVFLHGGILHLLFNSWALLTVGPLMEEIYGPRRLLALYVATGVAGSVASIAWRTGGWSIGIGASGAVCGLIGAAAAWGWRRGGRVGEAIKGQMVQWAIYTLVIGFVMPLPIDNAAHIGGLISGGLLGLVLHDGQHRSRFARATWEVIAWLCALLIVSSFVMVALHYEGTVARVLQNS